MRNLRATLPPALERVVWNIKYGLLQYPHFTAPDDAVSHLCTNLSGSGTLLELGCGRGSLIHGLRQAGWNGTYCGVDISERAISDARKRVDQRSSWIVSDIESFSSPFKWDAIVMIESIYYVDVDLLSVVLTRLTEMLEEEGFILIRLHDVEKHREYIEAINRRFPQMKWVAANLIRVG